MLDLAFILILVFFWFKVYLILIWTNLFPALNDAIEGANKIQNENVADEDLDSCLQNFGVYLPKPELEKIKELTGVDGKW